MNMSFASAAAVTRRYAVQNGRFNRAGRALRRALGVVCATLLSMVFATGAAADQTNAAGSAPSTNAAPIKLIAFGDSLIAGFGLPSEHGFVPQLQAWLDANGAGPVTVVNAGVSGDTTSGGLARLDWAVTPDADAVILELGANDMLRGVDPAIAKANLDQMLTRLKARKLPVLMASIPSLDNWGADYKRDFEAIFPALSEKHDAPLLSFLGGVAGEENLNQADGIHPNKRGVEVMVAALGPQIKAFVEQARAAKAAR